MTTRHFTIPQFAAFLGTLQLRMNHANHTALAHAAFIVHQEAQRVLGTYDYNWQPLAPSTVARKGADTPGLETREMRDTLAWNADHREAHIGSNLQKAVYFELGTSRQPPRSFLVEAARRMEPRVRRVVGVAIVDHLAGAAPRAMGLIP